MFLFFYFPIAGEFFDLSGYCLLVGIDFSNNLTSFEGFYKQKTSSSFVWRTTNRLVLLWTTGHTHTDNANNLFYYDENCETASGTNVSSDYLLTLSNIYRNGFK